MDINLYSNNFLKVKKNLFIILFSLTTVVILLLVILAERKSIPNESGKIKVITTLFPYYDFARIIGGEKAEVFSLLSPGVEVHAFEPKPGDIFKVNSADVFVYTGDFMELWAKDILVGINNKKLSVVKAGDIVNLLGGDEEGSGSGIDPHIWLDFSNSENIVNSIASAFVRKDPKNSDFYIENAHELKNELKDLDNSFKIGLSNCQTKTLIY